MKKKSLFVGMLAMVLSSGIVLAGCDHWLCNNKGKCHVSYGSNGSTCGASKCDVKSYNVLSPGESIDCDC